MNGNNSQPELPKSTAHALRHFNTVEEHVTPVLRLFCFKGNAATITSIRKAFRKLATMVHPDRCRADPRGATRSMRMLGRAMEMVNNLSAHAQHVKEIVDEKDFVLRSNVRFSLAETSIEENLRYYESHSKRAEEMDTQTKDRSQTYPSSDQKRDAEKTENMGGKQKTKTREEQREEEQEEIARKLREERAREEREEANAEDSEPRERQQDDEEGCEAPERDGEERLAGDYGECEGKDNEWWTGAFGDRQFYDDSRSSDLESMDEAISDEIDDVDKDPDNNLCNYIITHEKGDVTGIDDQWNGDSQRSSKNDGDNSFSNSGDGDDVTRRTCAGEQFEGEENGTRRKKNEVDKDQSTPKKLKRSEQKRASKRRKMERAKLAPKAEQVGARTWKPRRCVEITPETGMCLQFRWQREQLIRAYTAYIGVHQGVNITQTWEKVAMKCRNRTCSSSTVFNWQPRTGLWKLNRFTEHSNECSGQHVSGEEEPRNHGNMHCSPAYTPLQVARAILSEATSNPNISDRTIGSIFRAKQIYKRQPPDSHYRSVRVELLRHMNASRAVDMASLEGYAELLRNCGHTVRVFVIDGVEMKQQRIRSAKHIFQQCKKAKNIPEDATFNEEVLDLSDIANNGRYYGGLLFVPSVATRYSERGRKTAAADAAHCDGVGPQSYGTTFEVVTYDTDMHLLPLVFAHFIGSDCYDYWKTVFEACKELPGFDVPARTTIVDQEKSIEKGYKDVFEHAKMFLDPLHVRKNMGAKLGATKAIGISLYERALHDPSRAAVDEIFSQYADVQKQYLSKFDHSELYKAYSCLEDAIVTSQGAESQMSASLRNHIRTVEPQKMLNKVVLTQRSGFLNRQTASQRCSTPVPPAIERQIAILIRRSRGYQETVRFCDGNTQMEATVTSCTDGALLRRVRISKIPQHPPDCCGYSSNGDGFPCFHGVAVLCEKYGASNIHRFVAKRHLTAFWKELYDNLLFTLPSQSDVDNVISRSKVAVISGVNLNVPKALPPPRGRPVKNAGVRRKGWFERGPSARKKRGYSCALCHQTGHVSTQCQLRQLFDNQ